MEQRETNARHLASQNNGLVSFDDLIEMGYTTSAIRHRVNAGRWRKVAQRVYALSPQIDGIEPWLRAAVMTLPGAVVSHEAAAELYGLASVPRKGPAVTVNRSGTHSYSVVTVHRTEDLRTSHCVYFKGFPTTTGARTIVDLAAVMRAEPFERALDAAVSARLVTLHEVRNVMEQIARRGKPGVATLRYLLDLRESEPEVGHSELERRFVRLVRDAGIALPESQATVSWLEPWERVDFVYRDSRIAIELDGRRWHTDSETWESDRRRDQKAVAAGWTLLRFTWKQVTTEAEMVDSTLRSVLSRQRTRVS